MIIISRRNSLGDLLCGTISWALGFFFLGLGFGLMAALLRGVFFVVAGVWP